MLTLSLTAYQPKGALSMIGQTNVRAAYPSSFPRTARRANTRPEAVGRDVSNLLVKAPVILFHVVCYEEPVGSAEADRLCAIAPTGASSPSEKTLKLLDIEAAYWGRRERPLLIGSAI
jgi:hypothetical protein